MLDAESDRILDELARVHSGDRSLAVREALKQHEVVAGMIDALEQWQADELKKQKERSEKEFREGKVVSLEEIKRRHRT